MDNIYEIIPDEYTYLKKGDKLPDFSWKDESGKSFSSESLFGKETIIIFFAINCRHCRDTFLYLEKEFFTKKYFLLNIMAIGRGCDHEHLASYHEKYSLSIKLTADPDGVIYSKFAEKAVPRIYHFNEPGLLQHSIRGFRPAALDELIKDLAV